MIEETDHSSNESAGSPIANLNPLPETMHSHTIQLAKQTADMAAQQMTNHLVTTAKSHLEALLSQKQSIEDSTSHLALLMQRVNLQKSSLTRACDWYGQKTWFEKVGVGAMFVAAVSLIGAIVNLEIVFCVLAMGVYAAITSILQEHYDINDARDKLFCSNIRSLEQNLNESVAHLKELEGHLRIILIELAEKNLQSAEHILQFETNIRALNEKIIGFEQVIAELERIKRSLIDENARITTQLNTAHIDLEAANESLVQRSAELNAIQCEMRDTNQRIADKTSELNALCEKFTADSEAMSLLIQNYETQLQLLRTRISMHVPDETIDASMKEAIELRRQTDASIAKDNALITQIRLNRQSPKDVSSHLSMS